MQGTGLGIAPLVITGINTAASIIPKLFGPIANLIGKNAYEAGAPEVLRDFGVRISVEDMTRIFSALQVSESQAYPIRKDIISSPVVLILLSTVASQQGTFNDFMQRIGNVETAWGNFDFSTGFSIGANTGSWNELNQAYINAFSPSQMLQQNIPDWKTRLTVPENQGVQNVLDEFTNPNPFTMTSPGGTGVIQSSVLPGGGSLSTMLPFVIGAGVLAYFLFGRKKG